MTADFIKWAGRQLRPFRDHIEAHQRQQRYARMLRASPDLRRRAEAHERKQARHEPSKAEWLGMRDATNNMLRRSTHHG